MSDPRASGQSPLEALEALALQDVEIAPSLRLIEIYTTRGLLSIWWHGDEAAHDVVLMCGGAMGGVLGPAEGLYHDLGNSFAELGIATMRVAYRKPGDLSRCTHDLLAAAELASRKGASRFVTMGHSFGGAVAVQIAVALGVHAAGVVGLATQSAGCEVIDDLDARTPVLLFHGDRDELLPPDASAVVQMMAGRGELVVLPGDGHLLLESRSLLRERLLTWIPDAFASHPGSGEGTGHA